MIEGLHGICRDCHFPVAEHLLSFHPLLTQLPECGSCRRCNSTRTLLPCDRSGRNDFFANRCFHARDRILHEKPGRSESTWLPVCACDWRTLYLLKREDAVSLVAQARCEAAGKLPGPGISQQSHSPCSNAHGVLSISNRNALAHASFENFSGSQARADRHAGAAVGSVLMGARIQDIAVSSVEKSARIRKSSGKAAH